MHVLCMYMYYSAYLAAKRNKTITVTKKYKNKIDEHFKSINARYAWKGLNVMRVEIHSNIERNVQFINEMNNTFYARFDDGRGGGG